MKLWLYLAVAAFVLGLCSRLPSSGTDVAQLEPVELVCVMRRSGGFLICTDTGSSGWGRTPEEAVSSLKGLASKRIYLDTAQHFLLDTKAACSLEQWMARLRPDCGIYYIDAQPDLESAARYLDVHKGEMRICDVGGAPGSIPLLSFHERSAVDGKP